MTILEVGKRRQATPLVTLDPENRLNQRSPEQGRRFDKVVIVNPPSPPSTVANRDSQGGHGQLYPIGAPIPICLDIPYLLGFLSENDVPLEALEAQALDLTTEALAAKLLESTEADSSGRVLLVVRIAVCCLDWDLSVCTALKAIAPRVKLAVYGASIPEVRKRIAEERCVEYIIRGEPDETVLELVNGKPEFEIRGLDMRSENGWIQNPDRPLCKELDKLPFPKWELLPYKRYTLPKSSVTSAVSYLPMLTSRGCPFGCHYCPYPVNQGLPFRYRSPRNVVNEMEHLVRDLGIRYIIFRDPMFSLRQDRVVGICEEIQKRKLTVRWKCETRVDCLNPETIRAMAAAGCEGINFGIESSDVNIQARSGRKPITQTRIFETVALCRQLGIKTFGFFIVGLPGDTADTILESIEFAVRLRPSWVQFNSASPLVGTKLRKWAVENGFAQEDEYSYRNCHETTMGNENLSKAEVASLHKLAVIIERYLMNRGGVLKDEKRTDPLYRLSRSAANVVALGTAQLLLRAGRIYFRLSFRGSLNHKTA